MFLPPWQGKKLNWGGPASASRVPSTLRVLVEWRNLDENENLIQGRRDPEVCFALYSEAKCLIFKPEVLDNLIRSVQPTAGSTAQGASSAVASETAMPPVGSDVIPRFCRARPTARPLAKPMICIRCWKWTLKMGHLVTSTMPIQFTIPTRPFWTRAQLITMPGPQIWMKPAQTDWDPWPAKPEKTCSGCLHFLFSRFAMKTFIASLRLHLQGYTDWKWFWECILGQNRYVEENVLIDVYQ